MKFKLIILLITCSTLLKAQGILSGNVMANVNFFQRDTNIKASGNPLYDNLLSGGESWMNLTYNQNGFTAMLRLDAFQNSNLRNPTSALSKAGIGAYSLSKEYQNLTITAGHIYDQIGSGIIFRAYEDRGLLIDNALYGLQMKYKLNEHLSVKGMAGQTKNIFDRYEPIIKAANIEGEYDIKKVHITPGLGIINRTMDANSMNVLVSSINAKPQRDRFVPVYNNTALTFYNTLNAGNITWYVEAAKKTKEAIADANGALVNADGSVLFTTVGFSKGKIGINATGKRTENFMMRSSPNEILLQGIYNWQPIVAQIRPQRLIARYTPPSQDLSELAGAINGFYTPNDNYTFNVSYTHINTLDNIALYREVFADAEIRKVKNSIIHIGVQYLVYNQALYQGKNETTYPTINAITPMLEYIYKIDKKRTIRTELQYMSTKQDYGSWAFALIEYTIAPSWSFAVTDMYNIAPNKVHVKKALHYPNIFVAYSKDAHRFTAQYVKQVEGINCTGGVCRYEPAFSGFKIGMTSTF
jgi:hypothetical protein